MIQTGAELQVSLEASITSRRARLISRLEEVLGNFFEIRPGMIGMRHTILINPCLNTSTLDAERLLIGGLHSLSQSNPNKNSADILGQNKPYIIKLGDVWDALNILGLLESKAAHLSSLMLKFAVGPALSRCVQAASCPPVFHQTEKQPSGVWEQAVVVPQMLKQADGLRLFTIKVSSTPLVEDTDFFVQEWTSSRSGEKKRRNVLVDGYETIKAVSRAQKNLIHVVSTLIQFIAEIPPGFDADDVRVVVFGPLWVAACRALTAEPALESEMLTMIMGIEVDAKRLQVIHSSDGKLSKLCAGARCHSEHRRTEFELTSVRNMILSSDLTLDHINDSELRWGISNLRKDAAEELAIRQSQEAASNSNLSGGNINSQSAEKPTHSVPPISYKPLTLLLEDSRALQEADLSVLLCLKDSKSNQVEPSARTSSSQTAGSGGGLAGADSELLREVLQTLNAGPVELPQMQVTVTARTIVDRIFAIAKEATQESRAGRPEAAAARLLAIRQIFSLWLLLRPSVASNPSGSLGGCFSSTNSTTNAGVEHSEATNPPANPTEAFLQASIARPTTGVANFSSHESSLFTSSPQWCAAFVSDCTLLAYCAMAMSWVVGPGLSEPLKHHVILPDVIISLRSFARTAITQSLLHLEKLCCPPAHKDWSTLSKREVFTNIESIVVGDILSLLRRVFTEWGAVLPQSLFIETSTILLDYFLAEIINRALMSNQVGAADTAALRDLLSTIRVHCAHLINPDRYTSNNNNNADSTWTGDHGLETEAAQIPQQKSGTSHVILPLKHWKAFCLLSELVDSEFPILRDRKAELKEAFNAQQLKRLLKLSAHQQQQQHSNGGVSSGIHGGHQATSGIEEALNQLYE